MKKRTALLLALVMCLSLCACGGGTSEEDVLGAWSNINSEAKSQTVMYLSIEDKDDNGFSDCLMIESGSKSSTVLGDWQIENGDIMIREQGETSWNVYKYNSSKDTLTSGEVVFTRTEG